MDDLFGEVVPDEKQVSNLPRGDFAIEHLPKDDQEIAIKLIDALITKGKLKKLVS
jgi:hypothetical protein